MNIHYIVGKPLYIDYNHKTFMETPKLFQKNRKGQMGGAAMAIIFAFVALAVIGVIQLIGILITSKVNTSIEGTLPTDTLTKRNESVTISVTVIAQDNSTLLANDGYI